MNLTNNKEITQEKMAEYSRKILLSRLRILNSHSFFGLLLMHVGFKVDNECLTAETDGYNITFGPKFLEHLNESELDFIMMHEIMHIALKHCFRGTNENIDRDKFNIACDIVVNSNILRSCDDDPNSITVRGFAESMHLAPDGTEGYNYTVEELYKMIDVGYIQKLYGHMKEVEDEYDMNHPETAGDDGDDDDNNSNNGKSKKGKKSKSSNNKPIGIDDHEKWVESGNNETLRDEWEQRLIDAYDAMEQRRKNGANPGNIPLGAERLVKEIKDPTVDWRQLLNDFVSLEINDYSFTPPDKRYDGDFFLPDFNDADEVIKANLLFMVDTSGSISDNDLVKAYSEMKGAVELGNGNVKGYLAFFDTKIYGPIAFDDFDDILKVKPQGGGGTDILPFFKDMDKYIRLMDNKEPSAIVIFTDGYLVFPEEKLRRNIPVLWIINNDQVTPPWGIVARIKNEKHK